MMVFEDLIATKAFKSELLSLLEEIRGHRRISEEQRFAPGDKTDACGGESFGKKSWKGPYTII